VSDDPKNGATTIHASKDGGGAGKWLLGGLAALVVAGGGYFAWKNYAPAQSNPQTAYNDTYSSEPGRAGPIESSANIPDEGSTASDSGSSAASATRTTRSTAPHRASAQSPVPEETIGITPVSATTEDEDLIVNAPRRPIWSRTPSAQRLSAAYPEHAREVGREGEASLHCTVLSDGALDCVRVSEFPARAGFGNAALRAVRGFRHAPHLANGVDAAGSPVNLRVVFRMEDEPRRG
jgi:TonB family protein